MSKPRQCTEEWKPVVGYEGIYEVSDTGKVRSLTRKVEDSLGRIRTIAGQPKKTWIDKGGYVRAELCKDDKREGIGVHQLVAMAFLPTDREYVEVMHKDHNPQNNQLSNLEWGTHLENIRATIEAGRYGNGNTVKVRCPRGHEYSGKNSRGDRICKICKAETQRRYRARKKQAQKV